MSRTKSESADQKTLSAIELADLFKLYFSTIVEVLHTYSLSYKEKNDNMGTGKTW